MEKIANTQYQSQGGSAEISDIDAERERAR